MDSNDDIDDKIVKVLSFHNNYAQQLQEALSKINHDQIIEATKLLYWAALNNFPVYVFGNGGSASLSEHFSCDHTKGVRYNTGLRPNIISLSSNIPMITAIANDISYDEIFSVQLESFHSYGAVAIGISASGNSRNVCRGLQKAQTKGYQTLAFVGFDGGHIMEYNDAKSFVYVPSNNYGIVEDCHQIIMHSISQFFRTTFNNNKNELRL